MLILFAVDDMILMSWLWHTGVGDVKCHFSFIIRVWRLRPQDLSCCYKSIISCSRWWMYDIIDYTMSDLLPPMVHNFYVYLAHKKIWNASELVQCCLWIYLILLFLQCRFTTGLPPCGNLKRTQGLRRHHKVLMWLSFKSRLWIWRVCNR